jgi:ankyrin repeat protein
VSGREQGDAALLPAGDTLAIATTRAIQTGDVDELGRLLASHPLLATARLGDNRQSRTLLHVVADWPGHFSRGAATVVALVQAGADVDARFIGPHTETPLHWAASCDDVELIDAGADIDADGGVIAGGTPLTDATAFGQWNAARRLVERGAHAGLWESATLGLLDRVGTYLAADPRPTSEEITGGFWGACHGGQRKTADYLLDRGADLNWIGWDELTPLDAAERAGAADLAEWLRARGARSATALKST